MPAILAAMSKEGATSSADATAALSGRPASKAKRKAAPPGGRRRTTTSYLGLVISASSGSAALISPKGLPVLFAGEDRHRRKSRPDDARRRMRRESQIRQSLAQRVCKIVRGKRIRIGRVVGVEP